MSIDQLNRTQMIKQLQILREQKKEINKKISEIELTLLKILDIVCYNGFL